MGHWFATVWGLVLPTVIGAIASPSPRSASLKPLRPGDRILCLYDSTESVSADKNPLSGEFARAARAMGFDVTFVDVAHGPPSSLPLNSVRAVVTGFRDGLMEHAAAWPRFVRHVIDAGVRYVIVGNYGAWQERTTGAFVPTPVVNEAFSAIGVRYEADWTDDPSRLAIEVLEPALGPPNALAPERVRHFYRFTRDRADVRVLVKASRSDLPGESAVVFVSATGAMALSRYLSEREFLDDPAAMALDLNAFVRAAFARVPSTPGTLLVLHDPGSEDSARVVRSLSTVSLYSGITMSLVTLADSRSLRPVDLLAHQGLVLAVADPTPPLDSFLAGLARDYLAKGGRILSLLPTRNLPLASLLASHTYDEPPPVQKTSGIRFLEGSFPGLTGMEATGDTVALSGVRPILGKGCQVLAESLESVPLWWRCAVGPGSVMALNAYEFPDRSTVGLVLQAVLEAEGFWAMPILAAALEFVDDCPLPMTGTLKEGLGKTDTEFYRHDFLNMLLEAVAKYRIRPVALGIFSYDDHITPPFEAPLAGATGEVSRDLARQLVSHDLTVGLHGANHMSPALGGGVTKNFPTKEALAAWFRAGYEGFKAVFGEVERPEVFVPPNNWIDVAGMQALAAEVPSVRVLSAVLSGTEVETVQDFGPNPHVPGLVDVPRTWAGHVLSGEARLGMVNGVMLYGVSSHFIHPDDIFDPERSKGLSWGQLRQGYLAGIEEVRRRFPFLRELDVVQAADEVLRLSSVRWQVLQGPWGMEIIRSSGFVGPLHVFARTPRGCRPVVTGGVAVMEDPVCGLHVLRLDSRVSKVACRSQG